MIQRQRPRPAAWKSTLLQKLKQSDKSGRTAVAHLETDLALPFLQEFLRKERRKLSWESLNLVAYGVIVYLIVVLFCELAGWKSPSWSSLIGPLVGSGIGLWLNPAERRNNRWRNGLQAYLALLERATLSERLPRLLEVAGWLHTKRYLVTPETRRQYDSLLASSLGKANTALLQSLAPEHKQTLVALITRHRTIPEELLVAALLALADLRPESRALPQALRVLEYSSLERVRDAVQEYQRFK